MKTKKLQAADKNLLFIILGSDKVTRGQALDKVHNSLWPLDHLFALCDPVILTFDFLN